MRNIFTILLLAALLSGCGLLKSRSVERDKESFSTFLKSAVIAESEVKTKDKTITLETRKADTTIKSKKVETQNNTGFKWSDLAKGMVTLDNSFAQVYMKIDTSDSTMETKVVIKPQSNRFNFDESKLILADKDSTASTKNSSKIDSGSTKKTESKNIKSEPKNTFWLWAIGVVVLLLLFGLLRKK